MAKNGNESKTEVSQGIVVRGRLQGAEDVKVAGRVEGQIELSAELLVLKSGIVKAEIVAKRVIISGIVVGDITAEESIEVLAEGRVLGDISAPKVRIHQGARYSGALNVGDPDGKRVPTRPTKSNSTRPTAAREESRPVSAPVGFVRGQESRRRKRVVVKKRT